VGSAWFRRGRSARSGLGSYPPVPSPLPVEAWNTSSAHFAFGMPVGWRPITAEEAVAQGSDHFEVLGGAVSEQAAPPSAVMLAGCVSMGDMDEALRWPEQMVAVRQKGNARLTAGPERLRVADGRGLQIVFDETVPGEQYGFASSILQGRVETIFEGIGRTWVLQLVAPAETLAADLLAYQTALGTWRWSSG
jgi:hypothetical protein